MAHRNASKEEIKKSVGGRNVKTAPAGVSR